MTVLAVQIFYSQLQRVACWFGSPGGGYQQIVDAENDKYTILEASWGPLSAL